MPGGQIRIIFSDAGTGAARYEVESSPVVGTGSTWSAETQAQISPAGGTSQLATFSASGDQGFFRILVVDGSGGPEAVVSFDSSSITVNESAGTVSIPLTFSRPFQGTLAYQVSGSTTSQDIAPLSGTVAVDGTSAAITVELVDNGVLNELRFLTLDISAGTGYVLGTTNQASVIIQDDDTLWSGNFQEDNSPVGFTLRLVRTAAGHAATLVNRGGGIFPPGEFPAQVSLTETSFSLSVSSVPLSAASSLFNTAGEVSLTLSADDSEEGQSVEDAQIEGRGNLSLAFPSQPQLSTSLSGRFLMIKQVIKPSGDLIELSSN
jgi:hypothetical protein